MGWPGSDATRVRGEAANPTSLPSGFLSTVLAASQTPARYTQLKAPGVLNEIFIAIACRTLAVRGPRFPVFCDSFPIACTPAKRSAFVAGEANRARLAGNRKAPVADPRPNHSTPESLIGSAIGRRPK